MLRHDRPPTRQPELQPQQGRTKGLPLLLASGLRTQGTNEDFGRDAEKNSSAGHPGRARMLSALADDETFGKTLTALLFAPGKQAVDV